MVGMSARLLAPLLQTAVQPAELPETTGSQLGHITPEISRYVTCQGSLTSSDDVGQFAQLL